MEDDREEYKKFLEQQLQWSKKQASILDEINDKLHKMKKIVEYALDFELTSREANKLNDHLNELKAEVCCLEKQLQSVIH